MKVLPAVLTKFQVKATVANVRVRESREEQQGSR
jgi:hypothetical protein